MSAFDFWFVPACALAALTVVGFLVPARGASNAKLFGTFAISFVVIFGVAFAVLVNQEKAKLQKQEAAGTIITENNLKAHPVYASMSRSTGAEFQQLKAILAQQIQKGSALEPAFAAARPMLEKYGTQQMGFAEAAIQVEWGRLHLQTLTALQRRDPKLCFQRIMLEPAGYEALAQGFSESEQKEFSRVFGHLMNSVYDSMEGKHRNRPPPEYTQDDRQARYRSLRETWILQFGEPTLRFLERNRFEPMQLPTSEADICQARMTQLQSVINEPPGIAGAILDSMLRG